MSEADCMAEGREIDAEIESEGAVLLRNENNTLPLAKGTKVTILGAMSYNYVCGGTGSAGGKYDEYTYTMKEAFDGSKEQGSGVSRSTSMSLKKPGTGLRMPAAVHETATPPRSTTEPPVPASRSRFPVPTMRRTRTPTETATGAATAASTSLQRRSMRETGTISSRKATPALRS